MDSEQTSKNDALDHNGSQENDRLPEWWRTAIATFESHNLVEYHPPRFRDGTVIYDAITPLEDELGVNVDLVGYGSANDDEWFVRIDGKRVAIIDRQRRIGGQTVYDVDTVTFKELVRDAFDDAVDIKSG